MPITSVKGKANAFAKQMMKQQNKPIKVMAKAVKKVMKKWPKGC